MSGGTIGSVGKMEKLKNLLDERLSALEKTLASKKDIENLKYLIQKQNDIINKQDEKITILESAVIVLQKSVNTLKENMENSEQHSRRLCLRINGIPPVENESSDDCLNK